MFKSYKDTLKNFCVFLDKSRSITGELIVSYVGKATITCWDLFQSLGTVQMQSVKQEKFSLFYFCFCFLLLPESTPRPAPTSFPPQTPSSTPYPNSKKRACMAAIVVQIRTIGPIRTICPKWSDFWSEFSLDDTHA